MVKDQPAPDTEATFEAIIRRGVASDLFHLRALSGKSLEEVTTDLAWVNRNKLSRFERGAYGKNISAADYQQITKYFLELIPKDARGLHPMEKITGDLALDAIGKPVGFATSPMLYEYLVWVGALNKVGALAKDYPGIDLYKYLFRVGTMRRGV